MLHVIREMELYKLHRCLEGSSQACSNWAWNKALFVGLALCLGLGAATPRVALAQSQADIEAAQRRAETIERQERARLQHEQDEARRRAAPVDGMDTRALQPKIATPALGAPCRDVRVIGFEGAPGLAPWERARISAAFSGRCLDAADIEAILGQVTQFYIARGYITTRAYLPPQDLSKGRLEILVVEGVVETIEIDDGGAHSISPGNAFPLVAGRVLNLRDLEQGIDQINRLGSNNAQLDIAPGATAGASRVLVHNVPGSRFHLNLSADNQGAESTGKTQAGLSASVDNLLGLNDMLSASHRLSMPHDAGRRDSVSDSVNFSIPFGYSTLSLGTSGARYASTITAPSGLELISSGTSRSDNLRLERVLYRDQATRASFAASVTSKTSKNYLDQQLLAVSSRQLTVLDLDASLNTRFAEGALTLELGYAAGLNSGAALRDADDLPDGAPHAQFGKWKAGFSYARPFRVWGQDASFSSELTAQKAVNTLYGSEQIAIGGLYSVRGFVRNSLSGDDGYYLRNELSLRRSLTLAGETIGSRWYIAYDSGVVSNRAPNVPQGRLAGMALGVAFNWRGAQWELFHTRPVSVAEGMGREAGQTWLRVAYSF
ncbi:hemolysin activation/secretion protein [Oxalobacteraceae bacterium GrIS 1.11]